MRRDGGAVRHEWGTPPTHTSPDLGHICESPNPRRTLGPRSRNRIFHRSLALAAPARSPWSRIQDNRSRRDLYAPSEAARPDSLPPRSQATQVSPIRRLGDTLRHFGAGASPDKSGTLSSVKALFGESLRFLRLRTRTIQVIVAVLAAVGGAVTVVGPAGGAVVYPPIPASWGAALDGCSHPATTVTIPQSRVASTIAGIQAMAGTRFQGGGPCSSGRVSVWLTPGSERLARQIRAKYGPAVTILVGLTRWNGHPGRSLRCGPLPSWTTPPQGLSLSLHLRTDTVRSGDVVRGAVYGAVLGTVAITNHGSVPFSMDTGQPLQAVLIRKGTHDVVGIFSGGTAGTGYFVNLSTGQSGSVPAFVGTARCDGGVGSAVPPGKYQAVALVMDESGKAPRYLTPPVSFVVTSP